MLVATIGNGGAGSFLCSVASVRHSHHRLLSFRSSLSSGMRLCSYNLSLDCKRSKLRVVVVANAADSTQASSASTLNKTMVPDDGLSLSKIHFLVSFGVVGLGVGLALLGYGFGAYFSFLPGSEWSALMLTYGFPLAIIGMALKYAELKPVLCITYTDAERLRETCATPILKQVKSDVTRFRYGDEQHLDEALKRIFQYECREPRLGTYALAKSEAELAMKAESLRKRYLVEEIDNGVILEGLLMFPCQTRCYVDGTPFPNKDGLHHFSFANHDPIDSAGGIPRRSAPVLQAIREEVTEDGRYSLVLAFEAKALQLEDFEQRQAKFASFFGPGITAEIGKAADDLYEVKLISNTKAEASG